jgi:hypothetical protein
MSIKRRNRRAGERQTHKHLSFLASLLMEFYEFLENRKKPDEGQVRQRFINDEKRWKRYCFSHQLTEKATLLFNEEVAKSWKERYARQPSPARN